MLAANTTLIGTELKLYYDSHDLRTIHTIARNGTDMGLLKAQSRENQVSFYPVGRWHNRRRTLELPGG